MTAVISTWKISEAISLGLIEAVAWGAAPRPLAPISEAISLGLIEASRHGTAYLEDGRKISEAISLGLIEALHILHRDLEEIADFRGDQPRPH